MRLAVVLFNVFFLCSCVFVQAQSSSSCSPRLILVEENGVRYLLDENGKIYSYLIKPQIIVNFQKKGVIISTTPYGSPPVRYDNVIMECNGFARGFKPPVITRYLSSWGGEVRLPRYPYDTCSFYGQLKDCEGRIFESERSTIDFILK